MSVGIGLAWSAHARSTLARAAALASVPLCGLTLYLTYSRGGVIGCGVALVGVLVLSRNRWTSLAHILAAAAATAILIVVVRGEPAIANGIGDDGAVQVALVLAAAMAGCGAVAVATRLAGADRLRLPRPAAAVALPVLLVLVAGTALVGGRGFISSEWSDFQHGKPVSSGAGGDPAARLGSGGGNRNDYWTSARDAFKTDKLRGIGPGTFEYWWARHPRDPEFVRDAHSLYFEQLAELGLPGLGALLLLLGSLLWLGIRGRLRGHTGAGAGVAMVVCFGVYLVVAGVDWFWEYPALTALALAGISVAGAQASGRRRPIRWRARFALVVVALAAAATQVPGIVATQRVRASATAVSSGDYRQARDLATQAIDAEPWASSPYEQRAVAELRGGEISGARRDVQKARSHDPLDYRYLLTLAEVELRAGKPEAAMSAFQHALPLSRSSRMLPDYQAYTTTLYRRIQAALPPR